MANIKVLANSIHIGPLAEPTCRLKKRRVADREVVEQYFNLQRAGDLREQVNA